MRNMLDPVAADLVDAVARLCILRTEDYALINTVYKRQRHALAQQSQQLQACGGATGSTSGVTPSSSSSSSPAAYLRYLRDEVGRREEARCATERQWFKAAREWAAAFLTQVTAAAPSSHGGTHADGNTLQHSPIEAFWAAAAPAGHHEGGSFRQVYAAVIRHAYELRCEDLTDTPFAQLQGSSRLYAYRPPPSAPAQLHFIGGDSDTDAYASALAGLPQVHSLFFTLPGSQTLPATLAPPTAILNRLHPVSHSGALAELSRSRLASSRHVWLVLFFLWCHAVGASRVGGTSSSVVIADNAELRRWLAEDILLGPASVFLRSQGKQLTTLLMKVQAACGS
jgi:hypothetical protein